MSESLWKMLILWTLSNILSWLYSPELHLFREGCGPIHHWWEQFKSTWKSHHFPSVHEWVLEGPGGTKLSRSELGVLLYKLISPGRYLLICHHHSWSLVHKATLKIVFLVLSGLLALSMTFLPLSCLDSRKLGEWNCTPDFLGLAASPEPKSCRAFLCINHWLMYAVIAPSLLHWLPTPQTRKRFSNLEPRKSCIYLYFFNVDQWFSKRGPYTSSINTS